MLVVDLLKAPLRTPYHLARRFVFKIGLYLANNHYGVYFSRYLSSAMKEYILRRLPRNEMQFVTRRIRGFLTCLDISEYGGIAFAFQAEQVFASHFLIADHIVRPGDLVIDVGANVGIFSLHCARLGAQVYGFEPEALNYSICSLNKAINKFHNVEFFNVGVGETSKTATLHVNPLNSGAHSLFRSEAMRDSSHYLPWEPITEDLTESQEIQTESQDIQVHPLDYYDFAVQGDVRLLKVDVEGYELEVLDGMKKVLKESPPGVIFIEDRVALERFRNRATEYNHVLEPAGYTLHYLSGETLTRDATKRTNMSDCVFVHSRVPHEDLKALLR